MRCDVIALSKGFRMLTQFRISTSVLCPHTLCMLYPPPPSYTFFDLCPSSAPQRQLYTRQFVDFDMGHSVHTVDIGLAASGLLRDVMN